MRSEDERRDSDGAKICANQQGEPGRALAMRRPPNGPVHDPWGYFSGAAVASVDERKAMYRRFGITLKDEDFGA